MTEQTNLPTRGPWKVQRKGFNSSGDFVPTTRRVDIMPAWDGDGSLIPIAENIEPGDAHLIVAVRNALP